MTETKIAQKYRCAIVDTVNGIQNGKYIDLLDKQGKAGFDEWRDFAVEVLQLFNEIKKLPNCTLVNILGYEGSGKTFGLHGLNPLETMYLNCDDKDIPYFGWNNDYDLKYKNYSVTKSYEKVINSIKFASQNRKGHLIIFTLHHIATDKKADGTERERMKTLGKMATKLNVDGVTNHVYYTKVDLNAPEPTTFDDNTKYMFKVHGGNDTCRTPFQFWKEDTIPNNYQLIVNRILESVGEKNS